MPLGDPVLDYDGLSYYNSKIRAWTEGVVTEELAERHVPLYIGNEGVPSEFYVDVSTGNDTTGDGSQSKPWKTISHATEYVASNCNVNSRNVHINVAPGTYTAPLALATYSRTSGTITIRPATVNDTVNIAITLNSGGTAIRHTGGVWEISDCNLQLIAAAHGSSNAFMSFLRSQDPSGEMSITHCNLSFLDQAPAPVDGTYGTTTIKMVNSVGGSIRLRNKTGALECAWSGDTVGAFVDWLYCTDGGVIIAEGSSSSIFNVSGSFRYFCYMEGGTFRTNSGSPTWNSVDSPTGTRYLATKGGVINTGMASAAAAATYFPGNAAGSVDANSYSSISPSISPFAKDWFSASASYNVTLAEDITATTTDPYTITLPAGTKQAVARIITPAVATATAFRIRLIYSNGVEIDVQASSFLSTSPGRLTLLYATKNGGLSTAHVFGGVSNASVLTNFYAPNQFYFPADVDLVSISMGASAEGTVLPTGTSIKVYVSKEA